MKKYLLSALVFAGLISAAEAQEERVLWISIGDGLSTVNTATAQNAITNAMNFADANGFNAVSILARYRANSYYIPNREYSTFTNNEPRARTDFDAVQFTIDRARERNLRVYAAWSVFIVTDGSNSYPGFLDPNWRMYFYESATAAGTYDPAAPRLMVAADSGDGLWVDPGIPAVRNYKIEVLKDFVENYDVDGIILDRIRFPGDSSPRNNGTFGYTPQALSNYVTQGDLPNTTPAPSSTAFINARRRAVTDFVAEAAAAVYEIKPWVAVGGTPVIFGNDTVSTYNFVYQHIPSWSSRANPNHVNGLGALDFVMPQYYRDGASFSNITAMNSQRPDVQNMSHQPLFRAFMVTGTLAAHNAASICAARTAGDDGWGFFSYTGLNTIIADINATSTACGSNLISTPRPANIDYSLKLGWNSTPPGAIADLVANSGLTAGKTLLNWTAPSGAARYLVYRSTSPTVPQTYANLITSSKGITTTSFLDDSSALTNGTYYYRVLAVSGSNFKTSSNVASAVVSNSFILTKSRPGPSHNDGPGINLGPEYVETAGTWGDSSEASSAPGNSAFGSRFTTTAGATAEFRPAIVDPGFYIADYTTTGAASHNANVSVLVQGGYTNQTATPTITGGAFGNIWTAKNSVPVYFEAGPSGTTNFVRLIREASSTNRLNTDAIRFRLVESYPVLRMTETGAGQSVSFPLRDGRTVDVDFANVNAGAFISFTELNSNANTGGLNTAGLINQSFVIEPDNDFAFTTATVTLRYRTSQLNGLPNNASGLNAVFAVSSSDVVTVINPANISFDYPNNTVTISNVGSFSTWYIGSSSAGPSAVHDWMLEAY